MINPSNAKPHKIANFANVSHFKSLVKLLVDGTAFEVEFSHPAGICFAARNGRTYKSIGLDPEQIILLRFKPVFPDSKRNTITA